GQEVTHRALRPRLVIHLGIMAAETEGAVRGEAPHRSALVARDAVTVGVSGVRVPARRAAVTGGTIAAGVVVLFVATLAARCGGGPRGGYRRGVAGGRRDVD